MNNGSERIPETSDAEVLREAAVVMREAWGPAAEDARRLRQENTDPNHHVGTMPETMMAMAAVLDAFADGHPLCDGKVLAVARAYLGSAA